MIWFTIGLIVTFVETVQAYNEFAKFGLVMSILLFVSLGGLLLLTGYGLCALMGEILKTRIKPKETRITTKLTALKDIAGSEHYVTLITVGNKRTYCYMVQEDLGIRELEVDTDNAYIQYTDGSPDVTIIEKELPHSWYKLFAMSTWKNECILCIPKDGIILGDWNTNGNEC